MLVRQRTLPVLGPLSMLRCRRGRTGSCSATAKARHRSLVSTVSRALLLGARDARRAERFTPGRLMLVPGTCPGWAITGNVAALPGAALLRDGAVRISASSPARHALMGDAAKLDDLPRCPLWQR